jgi:hypothetical protein
LSKQKITKFMIGLVSASAAFLALYFSLGAVFNIAAPRNLQAKVTVKIQPDQEIEPAKIPENRKPEPKKPEQKAQPTKNKIQKPKKLPESQKTAATNKPSAKKKAKKQPKKGRMPAITIKYHPTQLYSYLKYLHSQGNKILITNHANQIISEYNPSTRKTEPPPTNLDGLSPRSRHIATHGQIHQTDKIIKLASNNPTGHKLIWLPNQQWETQILKKIWKHAEIKKLDPSEITAAEAEYTGNKLTIKSVSAPEKDVVKVNQ